MPAPAPQPTRTTRHRERVLDGLRRADRPLSAQELFVELRGSGTPVALATVYRQLQQLTDEGSVDRLLRESGEATFRVCHRGHHHHLICDGCGRVVEVRDCALDEWARALARKHGFSEVHHVAEFHGSCARCAAAGRTPPGRPAGR